MKLSLVLLLLAAAAAQEVKLRSEVRLVQVTVVAHDRKGAPIQNLQVADFVLTENGVPQKIAFFQREWEPKPAVKLPDLPAGAATNRTGVLNGATILLIDAVNTPPLYRDRAAAQVEAFLRDAVTRSRVAIYVQQQELTTVLDFTTDLPALVATLKNFQPERADARLDVVLAEQRLAQDALPGLIPEAAAMASSLMARELRTIQANHIPATLNTLRVIARRVRGVPGRKNLVWFTTGVPLRYGGTTYTTLFDQAMRELNDAGVAVYPASPHNLIRISSNLDLQPTQSMYRGKLQLGMPGQVGDERAMLSQTAGRSGGRLVEADDLKAGGLEIRADNDASYLLAYYPSQRTDGKWRKIDVRVARPGVGVRHRSGYFADAAESAETPAASLAAAVASPLDATGIGLDVWLAGGAVHVRIHGTTLPAEPRGGRFACPLEIVFVQADRAGKQLDGVRDTLPLVLTAQALQQALAGGFDYTKNLALQPQAATLRVAVRSQLNGAVGSVRLTLPPASAR